MSTKRNASELIDLFAVKAGISTTEAKLFIQALSETVTEVAISEGKATITGFGRFTISEVADREGTQPGTGESIIIPAHKRMNFTAYKKLAEMVNYIHEPKEAEELNTEEGKRLESSVKNSENTDTHTSGERFNTPISPETNRVTINEMEINNKSFTQLLEEIEAQTNAQKKAKKPVEFKLPDISHNLTTNQPEPDTHTSEDTEKAELLSELEQLIAHKNKQMTGDSLDIRIEDEQDADQNETVQKTILEQERPVSTEEGKGSKFASSDSSHNNPTRANGPKTYLSVEEDLLKEFMSSMDELNSAIKSINANKGRLTSSNNNTISFDKKIFIPGSFIGVILLLISGFLMGTNADRIFGQGFIEPISSPTGSSTQTNSTNIEQNKPSSPQLAGLMGENAQSTSTESANASDPSTTAEERQTVVYGMENKSTSSGSSTSESVRFRSEIGLYNMAQEIYGNPRLWVLLFEENFSTSQNPDDIADGTTLSVPKVATPGSFSEIERERLRIALLHVAQAYENAGKSNLAQSYRSASVYYPNSM